MKAANTMWEPTLQQGSESGGEKTKEGQGYMRSLHQLEEKLYSPESPLDYKTKVLLYIRHETIRWDNEEDEMSYSEISQKTGVHLRDVKEAVQFLEREKLICVLRRKKGNQHLANVIGLNPEYFGELIEKTCRPKFSVIEGGKDQKLSTVVPNVTPPLVINSSPPLVPDRHHETSREPPPLRQARHLKNPLKEQDKKLLSKIGESFTLLGKESESPDRAKERLKRQAIELEARGWK